MTVNIIRPINTDKRIGRKFIVQDWCSIIVEISTVELPIEIDEIFSSSTEINTKKRSNANNFSIDEMSCSLLSAMLVRLSETIRPFSSSLLGEKKKCKTRVRKENMPRHSQRLKGRGREREKKKKKEGNGFQLILANTIEKHWKRIWKFSYLVKD